MFLLFYRVIYSCDGRALFSTAFTCSFKNHSNMLHLCSFKCFILIMLKTVVLLNIFVKTMKHLFMIFFQNWFDLFFTDVKVTFELQLNASLLNKSTLIRKFLLILNF